MSKKKFFHRKTGNVVEISLPNGKYAYGRLYDDGGIGIYNYFSETPNNPPIGLRDFLFFVGIYKDIITRGIFPTVGKDPFSNDESTHTPPSYIYDLLDKGFSIYNEGKIIPSTKQECIGMERTSVWDYKLIIDRIMGKTIKELFNENEDWEK